jgi:hypothetical protein
MAWLISADDWAHLESLVAYNCALLGGYFNALIPLTRAGAIDAAYEPFLLAYDPDLIVLAPDMEQTALEPFLRSHPRLNPFGVVPWDALHLVAARDPRDTNSPWMNAPIPLDAPVVALDGPPSIMVATAEDTQPATSRLALVACGDLTPSPSEPVERRIGPREAFLGGSTSGSTALAQAGFLHGVLSLEQVEGDVSPYVDAETGQLRTSPSCEHLAHRVAPEHKFPLTGACQILDACYRLQLPWHRQNTLVGCTALYAQETMPTSFVPTGPRRNRRRHLASWCWYRTTSASRKRPCFGTCAPRKLLWPGCRSLGWRQIWQRSPHG